MLITNYITSIRYDSQNTETNQHRTQKRIWIVSLIISQRVFSSTQHPVSNYTIKHNSGQMTQNYISRIYPINPKILQIVSDTRNYYNAWECNNKNLIEAMLGGFTFIGIGAQSSLQYNSKARKIHFQNFDNRNSNLIKSRQSKLIWIQTLAEIEKGCANGRVEWWLLTRV